MSPVSLMPAKNVASVDDTGRNVASIADTHQEMLLVSLIPAKNVAIVADTSKKCR
jgi:hypothetical protein